MALLTGPRQTYYASSGVENILVRFVEDEIAELEPDVTPLLVMSVKAQRKRATYSPKIEVIEDALRGAWVYHTAAAIDSVTTTVVVNDGSLVATSDLLSVMKVDSSAVAEEVIRVTAKSGNTLTVTRAIGGSGADTISQTQALLIIGSAYGEGAAYGAPRTTQKTPVVSYTQIFREPVQITGTQRATRTYGGQSEALRQEAAALKQLKLQIEKAGFWSRASESLAENATYRTTMGLKAAISTNVTNGGTTLTQATMNTFSESAFRFGSRAKLFVGAPKYISAINSFVQGQLMTKSGDTVYGVQVMTLVLPHGRLLLANNWLMEDGISGQAGLDDEAYAVDLGAVEWYYLAANGVSRDVALYRNVVKDGVDAEKHEFLGECGWVFKNQKKHARIHNVSAY